MQRREYDQMGRGRILGWFEIPACAGMTETGMLQRSPSASSLLRQEAFDVFEEDVELVVVDPVSGVGDADTLGLGE